MKEITVKKGADMTDLMTQSRSPRSNPHVYDEVFKLPKPQCCSHGDCCKGASPSTPVRDLWAKAAEGDEFARNFLSIFIPYSSHDAARRVVPGLVDRTLKAALKHPHFESEADVTFYHCRYLGHDNRCLVYEDRPQFCRDYPDTPFVVMAPGCAFEEWGQACRSKYHEMKAETDTLRALQASLHSSGSAGSQLAELPLPEEDKAQLLASNLPYVLALTNLYVASPLISWWH
jgi:Fe-S-cluster containining protein